MIRKHVSRTYSFLRTTGIGGIFFLLPLVVVGALLGQVIQVVWVAAGAIDGLIPVDSPWGYSLLFLGGLGLIVLACFGAGLIARRAIGKRFLGFIEKYLLMLFPRYSIFKEQLSGNIGGHEFQNSMTPVYVDCMGIERIAMEIERDDQGRVVVFLPGSPDPWTGTVIVLKEEQVQPLPVDFASAMATFEQLGRTTLSLTSGTERATSASSV